jgi:hypothetical protein
LFQFQSRSLREQLRNAAASEVGGAADLVEVEKEEEEVVQLLVVAENHQCKFLNKKMCTLWRRSGRLQQ